MPDAEGLVGRMLGGRYRVVGVLGAGGMATIYRAEQQAEPYEVAVKVLHARFARDPAFTRRFRREASVASLLTHPNVVRVLDYGGEGERLFIVMELLRGEDLFGLVSRAGPLDAARAVRILIDVCDALVEAHGLGIVHRDLKPENVFLTRAPDGGDRVKILDFGIAKMLDPEPMSADSAPELTVTGSILGTPEYMSPEQCRGDMPDPRSDIYACGALLYALLTGRPPFLGSSPMEILCKQVAEAPVPPRARCPDLHPALEAAVLKALAKEPRDRHASAAAFAAVLRAALAAVTAPRLASVCTTLPAPALVRTESATAALRFASECATLRPRPPALSLGELPTVALRFASERATLHPRPPESTRAAPPMLAPIAEPLMVTPIAEPLMVTLVAPPGWSSAPKPAGVEVPRPRSVPPPDARRVRRLRARLLTGAVFALALVVLALACAAPASPAGRSTPIVVVR